MNLYAESSAVLAWLFREAPGPLLEEIMERAELVVASDLTLLECHRALVKVEAAGQLSQFEVGQRRSILENVSSRWTLLKIDEEILDRAQRRFPQEPVRSLDSLHLATAVAARSLVREITLLSLDRRIRDNGAALGFDVVPG
ncbi:MAG TPA: type II toxin-antitoxin system VapC family toxin [Thermoanaerobaculia bacterium]|jgi:predicted nucleic acid-binding protein|nr:type II toxin-antitoxin system VapC family toxin [Thermoanaerobaculia bacterium]